VLALPSIAFEGVSEDELGTADATQPARASGVCASAVRAATNPNMNTLRIVINIEQWNRTSKRAT